MDVDVAHVGSEMIRRQMRVTPLFFSHDHPSGVAVPSQADELIIQRLKDALTLVAVRSRVPGRSFWCRRSVPANADSSMRPVPDTQR
jgi:RadC-like JAB domain